MAADDLSWIKPGAKAVILGTTPGGEGYTRALSVTVDRVLTRDVVLSSGERFRLTSHGTHPGELVASVGQWGPSAYLVPPEDPRIPGARRGIQHRNLKFHVRKAFERWQKGEAGPGEVVEAFQRLAVFEGN